MGQSTSKGLSKAAGKAAAKQTPSLKRPPIPSRTPHAAPTITPSPQNPGSFLRGTGVAAHDIRDRDQEMYLQRVQEQREQNLNQKLEQQSSGAAADNNNNNAPAETSMSSRNTDMPEDLLKFIQDVGPAKQSVDREFTTNRLLEEENLGELNKAESVRTAKRERVRMPLMQGVDNFTTVKNTNFNVRTGSLSASASDRHDFGLSNLQLYDFLIQKDDKGADERFVGDFHEKILSDEGGQQPDNSSPKGKESKKEELELMKQTLKFLEVPTLRINSDGDILGLPSKEVPGPENTSVSAIPENKIIMVLKDLSMKSHTSSKTERTTEKFKELTKV
jgi:hypothetical protein